MKKTAVFFSILFLSLSAMAQDSTHGKGKADTAYVPIYEKRDTARGTILYLGAFGKVHYTAGYAVVKGYQRTTPKGSQWISQPIVEGYFSNKGKRITRKVIQIF